MSEPTRNGKVSHDFLPRLRDRFTRYYDENKGGERAAGDSLRQFLAGLLETIREEFELGFGMSLHRMQLLFGQEGMLVATASLREDGPRYSYSRTLVDQVVTTGKTFVSQDVRDDQKLLRVASLQDLPARSVAVVPLRFRDAVVGAVYVDSERPGDLTPLQVDFLEALAWAISPHLAGLPAWLEEKTTVGRAPGARLLGVSEAMKRVLHDIDEVAASDLNVLILGESGTGKELIARRIHALGRGKDKPYRAINCAAIAVELLESQLFGHEVGSFTGAVHKKLGELELARGGTVLLDEVGDMEVGLQAKLLRVLQEREFTRVGGTEAIRMDARVIAATNRNVEEAVAAGTLREDVYYRLNEFRIHAPPLRERREDLRPLVEYFIRRHGGGSVIRVSPEAVDSMMTHDWPGNVRELEYTVRRLILKARNAQRADIDAAMVERELPAGKTSPAPTPAPREWTSAKEAHDALDRELILAALAKHKGNKRQTAKELQISPVSLYRKMHELGIAADRRRDG